MRVSNMFLLAAICAPLLSACVTASGSSERAANSAGDPCPSLEGYPDCQNGHRVDLAHLTADPAEDRARIQDLQARYELALDSGDAAAYAALFTPDGVLEAPGDVARGREAIRQELLEMQKRDAQQAAQSGAVSGHVIERHVVSNVVIRVDGDKATSTASWVEMDDKNPGRRAQIGAFGQYQDQFVKTHGHWLFSKRKVVVS
jgi:uncharacterized protein (TIGR02246 family)